MHSPESAPVTDAVVERDAAMRAVVAELEAEDAQPSMKRAPGPRRAVERPAFHTVVRYDAMPGTDPKSPPKFNQMVASTAIRPGSQVQASDRTYRVAEDGSLRRLCPAPFFRSKKARRRARAVSRKAP